MSGERFLTLTPIVWTTEGRLGAAMAVRFCTSTWAMLISVPTSKVTSRVYEPSLLDCEDMYSMWSTPLTCCSIGAATVSATTWALAPGYWIDTCTPGGVICGYCAIGKVNSAIPPARAMAMDSTVAKIGRSMKKRVSMSAPHGGWAERGHRRGLGPHLHVRPDLLERPHDDLVVRFQSTADRAHAVFLERPRDDLA